MATASALAAWRAAIGERYALDDAPTLAAWGRTTFPWAGKAQAILSPGSAEETLAVLRIAHAHRHPLHPVSRGRAWGLGSRSPLRNAAVLDLSRLDRILDVDLVAGTARIEPGVTFRQLHEALVAADAPFHLPAFGGPPDASVLANALDRGDGIGAGGDRFAHLWDLDVALTTGERFRTGYGRFEKTNLEQVHSRPAGPLLEGLFSQSGFGCVLSGRIGLVATPRYAREILFEIGDASRLPSFAAATAALVSQDLIEPHCLFLWDGAKRASIGGTFAMQDRAGKNPANWRKWGASVQVFAHHRALFNAKLKIITEALAPLALETSQGPVIDTATRKGLIGYSGGGNLATCYWAKPHLPTEAPDPDRDGCGFLWLCPVIPLEGKALLRLTEIVENARNIHPTFLATGFGVISARAAIGYLSLAWDRSEPGADADAMAAHALLAEALNAEGFHAYRPTWPGLATTATTIDDGTAVLTRLRQALDPDGILSPGRVPGLE